MVSALGPPLRGQGQGWVEHTALCSRARAPGPGLGRGQGPGPGPGLRFKPGSVLEDVDAVLGDENLVVGLG